MHELSTCSEVVDYNITENLLANYIYRYAMYINENLDENYN
jgi:hypothetical protein